MKKLSIILTSSSISRAKLNFIHNSGRWEWSRTCCSISPFNYLEKNLICVRLMDKLIWRLNLIMPSLKWATQWTVIGPSWATKGPTTANTADLPASGDQNEIEAQSWTVTAKATITITKTITITITITIRCFGNNFVRPCLQNKRLSLHLADQLYLDHFLSHNKDNTLTL